MRIFALFALLLCSSSAGLAAQLARYAVILSGPAPVTDRAQRGRLQPEVTAAQEAIREQIRQKGFRITGSAHNLMNAVFVELTPGDEEQLKAIPGVMQVVRLKRFHRNLDHAERLINVPAAWNLLNGSSGGAAGNAGAGIKIGIIDTGIEAAHPAFQDPSLMAPAGFPLCQVQFPSGQWLSCTASDTTKGFPICTSSNCAYVNGKVIVARSYVPLLGGGSAASSRPDDPSPRDRVGHGTAVAMAAAGETATGPADTITGVAPKAFLGSYKIFGSPGLNDYTSGDLVIQAIDDAYGDGMDIVVLSLGAPALSGPLDMCGQNPCDPEATAVQQAVNAGLIVVAAGGNEGQNGQLTQSALSTVGSPGDAPGAIAVAATTNSHTWGNPLTVTGLGTYDAEYGSGPVPSGTFSGPLGDVANVGDPLGCTAPPAGSLSGVIALVQRGTCTFLQKVQNLAAAGAIGAIFTNYAGDDTLVNAGGLNGTPIPSLFIGYDDGQTIRHYLAGTSGATVSISPNFGAFNVATYNQVAPFSSHGPVTGTGALKPDIAAVGVDLYLAGQNYDPNGELYTPSGFLVSQGTSFSAPQVAGIAALVKQNHSSLTPGQIASAIVNTASQSATEGGKTASVLAVGAGIANAANAVSASLVVSPVSVSFGALRSASLPITQPLQLTNIGTAPLTLSVTINRRTPETTAHTSIDLPNLTLAAGQTGSINLLLSGTMPAPGIYEGFVTVQSAASQNPMVNIPYVYLVGSGVPANLISVAGVQDDGAVGRQSAGGFLIFQVVDASGVPVTNLPVTFTVQSGGGQLVPNANQTDSYGLGGAAMILGPNPGNNVYTASAGGFTASFTATGRLQPTIAPNGAVNAANYSGQPPAPGSYIALFGSNLADSPDSYSTPYLPVALNNVSVSFDNPNVSVPGHIVFVSPGQVNVQVPWELQGQPSVQVKVSVADSSGAVFTMPLGSYSPALFQIASGGQNIAAALDAGNNIVTALNPVAQGQVVQLFANGLGPVSNQPASGDPAPSGPLAMTTTTPTVSIGGVNAQVQFSGMTPGNAALYQINAVVPQVGAGLQPITISIGGVVSQSSLLPVK